MQPEPKPKTPASETKAEEAERPLRAEDLAGLDLSVEKVEERISPSETNVFDK